MTSSASLRRGLIALSCLVAAGCAGVTNEPIEDAITTVAPTATVATPATAELAMTSEPASAASPVAALAGSTENPIDELPVAPAPPSTPTADVPPLASELAVVATAPPTTKLEAVPHRIPSGVASPMPAETLDFSSLVSRLRKTKAISLLTKVSVKNESEALLEEFRAYHTQHGIVTLGDLRRSYDLLFHKLYSLLEEADPPLARDIDRSRAAIWEFLADPRKFSASPLMAGA